jgi:hypothetical protein
MRNWSCRRVVPLAGLSLAIAWFPVFVRLAGDRGFIPSITLLPTTPAQLLVSLAFSTLALYALSTRIDFHDQAASNEAAHITSSNDG